MVLKFYNTLIRKKEKFVPIKKDKVGIYTCGPTVYWFGHAGNMRAYIFADVLKRVLTFNGFDAKHIINVTDVGHLTSDADEGEDKLEKSAKREGKTAKEVSHFYFDAFLKDFKKLNLIEPFKWTWATEHIKEQVDMIKVLEKKGYTYRTSDGVYFDTSKFADYGKLSRKKIEGLEGGKRIDLGEKKNITDFALWKFSKPEEKRQQEWDSPWEVGFPGWHIECSAMASKYLGKHFDIHTGGEDHIPIHHENEIAQSEATFGKSPWVNYWMHGGFLNFKGGKMSKSAGTVKTISELEESGVSALAYRYFTYTAHYRKPLTWSKEALEGAVSSYKKLKNIVSGIESSEGVNREYLKEFENRINDDLDMPGAVAVLWKLVRDEKVGGKIGTIKKMDEVFGLDLLEKEEVNYIIKLSDTLNIKDSLEKINIPKEIKEIIENRAKARKEKDWKKSDELRDDLQKKGIIIRDIENGYEIEKVTSIDGRYSLVEINMGRAKELKKNEDITIINTPAGKKFFRNLNKKEFKFLKKLDKKI